MSILSTLGCNFGTRKDERRKASRRHQNVAAWVRPEGSFAMQPCKLIDMSSLGVRISVDRPEALAGTFLLLTSRSGSARRVRLKWRQGNQIGAEFV